MSDVSQPKLATSVLHFSVTKFILSGLAEALTSERSYSLLPISIFRDPDPSYGVTKYFGWVLLFTIMVINAIPKLIIVSMPHISILLILHFIQIITKSPIFLQDLFIYLAL